MPDLDINAFVSALLGGAGVFVAIRVDIAVLKEKYTELRRRFDEHEKKGRSLTGLFY